MIRGMQFRQFSIHWGMIPFAKTEVADCSMPTGRKRSFTLSWDLKTSFAKGPKILKALGGP